MALRDILPQCCSPRVNTRPLYVHIPQKITYRQNTEPHLITSTHIHTQHTHTMYYVCVYTGVHIYIHRYIHTHTHINAYILHNQKWDTFSKRIPVSSNRQEHLLPSGQLKKEGTCNSQSLINSSLFSLSPPPLSLPFSLALS